MVEVGGSSPLASTKEAPSKGAFCMERENAKKLRVIGGAREPRRSETLHKNIRVEGAVKLWFTKTLSRPPKKSTSIDLVDFFGAIYYFSLVFVENK